VVSAFNSLVGGSSQDLVGGTAVVALTNGNYVVVSHKWQDMGAVTWGNGVSGTTGVVSSSNSLTGSSGGDAVGSISDANGVVALANGNYVVCSRNWSRPGVTRCGAVTWGDGVAGTKGTVFALNSFIGRFNEDHLGAGGIVALSNGNYVVCSPDVDDDGKSGVGAVTWFDGTGPTTGEVSADNSLIGAAPSDAWVLRVRLRWSTGTMPFRVEGGVATEVP
jgi:hypothetical protein